MALDKTSTLETICREIQKILKIRSVIVVCSAIAEECSNIYK